MKKTGVLILILFVGLFSYSQKSDVYTFEWFSKIKIDTLHKIGHKHMYLQYCMLDMDSIIANGIVINANAEVANISNCRYAIHLKDTIIEEITITTNKKKSTLELKTLIENLNVNFKSNRIDKKNSFFLTDCVFNNKHCILLYIEEKNMKKGKLILKLIKL